VPTYGLSIIASVPKNHLAIPSHTVLASIVIVNGENFDNVTRVTYFILTLTPKLI
jgi:hypothetical protein